MAGNFPRSPLSPSLTQSALLFYLMYKRGAGAISCVTVTSTHVVRFGGLMLVGCETVKPMKTITPRCRSDDHTVHMCQILCLLVFPHRYFACVLSKSISLFCTKDSHTYSSHTKLPLLRGLRVHGRLMFSLLTLHTPAPACTLHLWGKCVSFCFSLLLCFLKSDSISINTLLKC